jgi:hypothetical protein
MLDLLAFGLCRPAMIVLGFEKGAGLMRWAQVVQIIGATEFKSANMLRNPPLAPTFNLSRA